MHLLRVQVPDFRGLKNIDITFEKDFFPSIFPLGSQNGGGKSTLLQLIFVLLHCSIDDDKKPFLQNLLQGFKISDGEDKRVLAIINIWDGRKTVEIVFWVSNDAFVKKLLYLDIKDKNVNEDYLGFSCPMQLKLIENKIADLESVNNSFQNISNRLDAIKNIEDNQERIDRVRREIMFIQQLISNTENPVLRPVIYSSTNVSIKEIQNFQDDIKKRLEVVEINLSDLKKKYMKCEETWEKIIEDLKSKNMTYICNYSSDKTSNNKQDQALLCHSNDIDRNEIEVFLNTLSSKIFLAAPSTQIFLFFDKSTRELLFRSKAEINQTYSEQLNNSKLKLKNFFTYDFLEVDLLIESFKTARDIDFKEAIETGEYGNNYQTLVKELTCLLANKKINLDKDLSGLTFKLDNNGETIELYPEDLSHGELKRLSIYIWLKSRNIEDAIVLMDEVEIAFHPDWQYQIISDLKEWAPSNQYILATHSYALCEALTPAHVKEIEPKLIKQES